MPDAAAQMHEKGEGEDEQYDLPDPGGNRALHSGVGVGPHSARDQPRDEADRRKAQENARDPMRERQDGGELRAVDLDVWRYWKVALPVLRRRAGKRAFRSSGNLSSACMACQSDQRS